MFESDLDLIPELSAKWSRFLALGVLLMVMGVLAFYFALFTTLISVSLLGILLVISGLGIGIHSIRSGRWSGFFLYLMLSLLYVIVGILLLANPAMGAVSITLFLGAFFMISGLFRAIGSLVMRIPHWGWFLFSGVITFILGFFIWKAWPASSLYFLGMFTGIDLFMMGWVLVLLAMRIRPPYQHKKVV